MLLECCSGFILIASLSVFNSEIEITDCLSLRRDSRESSQLVSSESNLCALASRMARSSSKLRIFIIVESTSSLCRFIDSVAVFTFSRRLCIFCGKGTCLHDVTNFSVALQLEPSSRMPEAHECAIPSFRFPRGTLDAQEDTLKPGIYNDSGICMKLCMRVIPA